MTPDEIETLLHREESDTLDFKQAQYPFEGADPHPKSELLKDILAFANTWKSADAHIVIGARDNPGRRATLVGGIKHIDDAALQQFINGKTNRAVRFEYIPLTLEGKSLGVIRIRRDQHRPIYVRTDFGKVKAGAVWIRRGSSSDVADPDEITRMAESAFIQEPALQLLQLTRRRPTRA